MNARLPPPGRLAFFVLKTVSGGFLQTHQISAEDAAQVNQNQTVGH